MPADTTTYYLEWVSKFKDEATPAYSTFSNKMDSISNGLSNSIKQVQEVSTTGWQKFKDVTTIVKDTFLSSLSEFGIGTNKASFSMQQLDKDVANTVARLSEVASSGSAGLAILINTSTELQKQVQTGAISAAESIKLINTAVASLGEDINFEEAFAELGPDKFMQVIDTLGRVGALGSEKLQEALQLSLEENTALGNALGNAIMPKGFMDNTKMEVSALASLLITKLKVGGGVVPMPVPSPGTSAGIKEMTGLIGTMKNSLGGLVKGFVPLFSALSMTRILTETLAPVFALLNRMIVPLFIPLQEMLLDMTMQLMPIVRSLMPAMQEIFLELTPIVLQLVQLFANIVNWLVEMGYVKPVVLGLVGAFVLYKTILIATSVWTAVVTVKTVAMTVAMGGLKVAILAAKGAMFLFNTVAAANPIVLIILATAAAVSLLLYYGKDMQNWLDTLGNWKYTIPIIGQIRLLTDVLVDPIGMIKKLWGWFNELGNWKYIFPITGQLIATAEAIVWVTDNLDYLWGIATDFFNSPFMYSIPLIGQLVLLHDVIVWVIDSFDSLWETVKNVFTWIYDVYKNTLGIIVENMKWILEKAVDVKHAISGTVEATEGKGEERGMIATVIDYVPALAIAKKLFGFADGGIVTEPVMGMVGEAGPEAVIPLGEVFSPNIFGSIFGDLFDFEGLFGGLLGGGLLSRDLSSQVFLGVAPFFIPVIDHLENIKDNMIALIDEKTFSPKEMAEPVVNALQDVTEGVVDAIKKPKVENIRIDEEMLFLTNFKARYL